MPKRITTFAATLLVSCASLGGASTVTSNTEQKRNALLVAGAFSKPSGDHYGHAADLYSANALSHGSMVRVCANTVKRHILEANGIVTDVFQHSWNPELAEEFERAYVDSPFETFMGSYQASFEDNRPYEKRLRPFYEEVYRNHSATTSDTSAINANDPTHSLLPANFARLANRASIRAKAAGEDPVAAAAAAVAAAEAASRAAANTASGPGDAPRLDWSQISWSLSISRAIAMMQEHEQKVNVTYDRIILVRPDVLLLDRNLTLSRLPRGRVYCTSWGRAAGDFHFVMERAHARALMKVHYPVSQPLVFMGHGWIRNVVTNAIGVLPTPPAARCSQASRRMEETNNERSENRVARRRGDGDGGGTEVDRVVLSSRDASARLLASSQAIVDSEWCPPLQVLQYGQGAVVNDLQVHGGMDEDVYRKVDFAQMMCNGLPYWKKFWAQYGMNESDWTSVQALGKPCPVDRPLFAIHRMCCSLNNCQTRAESKGACCFKSKHGGHHCLQGPEL